jgi:SP family general alpha glucoside:H+ symporter-like MFS transporter
MSSIKEKDEHGSVEVQHNEVHGSEILVNKDLMNDAFDGENQEHEEGVWASAKAHPWACFWAFIMCFTIVS